MAAGLINQVLGYTKKGEGFQPSKDIASMSFAETISKIDHLGDNRILVNDDLDFINIDKQVTELSNLVDSNYSQLFIKDIKK